MQQGLLALHLQTVHVNLLLITINFQRMSDTVIVICIFTHMPYPNMSIHSHCVV